MCWCDTTIICIRLVDTRTEKKHPHDWLQTVFGIPCFCILRQMIWTMHFEISFLNCQRMHWSWCSKQSLERENSNFTGGLFQRLNLYDAQVCLRVSNDHSNNSIVVAGHFEVSDAGSRLDQGGTTVMGKNMKSSRTTMFIFSAFSSYSSLSFLE